MKKLYKILKILPWCFIGVFVGSSIYRYYDYKMRPGLYELQSAPWYLSIQVNGILTALIVVGIFIVMLILRKKMK